MKIGSLKIFWLCGTVSIHVAILRTCKFSVFTHKATPLFVSVCRQNVQQLITKHASILKCRHTNHGAHKLEDKHLMRLYIDTICWDEPRFRTYKYVYVPILYQ